MDKFSGQNKVYLRLTIVLAFLILSLSACGARNMKPGEIPKPNEGIAYIRIIQTGTPSAIVHLFIKGDRIGPHKARIDSIEGDHVYAVIMEQGEYDIGQISVEGKTHIWRSKSLCPTFKVLEGKRNYIGTLALAFEPSKWFLPTRKYEVACGNSADDEEAAFKMYLKTYEPQKSE